MKGIPNQKGGARVYFITFVNRIQLIAFD